MSEYETLSLTIASGLATITLDRPEKLNSLNGQLKSELATAIRQIGSDDSGARALLIAGAGKVFCAGADLSEGLPAGRTDAGASLIETYHPFLHEIAELKIPIVSAVNGAAAGAGMSIAISADIVIASESAYFLQAFVKIGLVPDAGSTFILPRLIGDARAKAMMMLGDKVPAKTALEWGMIHKVVADDDLLETATALAQGLADGPTVALSGIRSLMRATTHNSFGEQLQAEAMSQRKASQSADCVEGVTAFIEKRPAKFTGR